MFVELVHSQLFLLTLTVGTYYGASALYKRYKSPLLNPLLVSIAVLILLLKGMRIDYAEYYAANSLLDFLLKLSIVSLGYLLYRNMGRIREQKYSILCATLAGSITGVAGVLALARLLGADHAVAASLQSKSVTMPIALAISEHAGGVLSLTAVGVVLAGILGSVLGPWFLDLTGIRTAEARGLALGAASHVVGTARALEMGAVEGALGGAAIGLMGVLTAILVPIIEKLC